LDDDNDHLCIKVAAFLCNTNDDVLAIAIAAHSRRAADCAVAILEEDENLIVVIGFCL